ncbi:MAG TPA: ribosome maturation factor RimM [Spirochaetota bacterium]|nr:ribosome maturation factor RimM [Spirochaetota bacterium]HOM37895.1 ribosome maturation factor RimM [Spirochaetota bacterium]HPQ48699.1 ribosome maturation factor RimM [Spirochaetota bacterium]
MEKIVIGKIVNTRGIKGDLILLSYTEPLDNILKYKTLYFKDNNEFKEIKISKISYYRGNRFVMKLNNTNNINEVLKMRGKNIYIDFSEIKDELKDNQFFYFQAIGSKTYIGEKYIGKVVSVHNFGSCDILEVIYKNEKNKRKQVMLPVLDEYIEIFDLDNKVIKYKDIDGLL